MSGILISNPGAATQLAVAARLLDAAGVTVASLGVTEVFSPLAGSALVMLLRSIDATGLAPGDYTVEARATQGTTLISRATAPVRILTDRTARVTLSSRRTVWQAGETMGTRAPSATSSPKSR